MDLRTGELWNLEWDLSVIYLEWDLIVIYLE